MTTLHAEETPSAQEHVSRLKGIDPARVQIIEA